MNLRTGMDNLTYEVDRRLMPFQCIDAGVLKILACITMLIDHIGAGILGTVTPERQLLYQSIEGGAGLYSISRAIGRQAMIIFMFLMVEGFVYTRNRCRYLGRLFLFALLSEVPFCLAFQVDLQTRIELDTLFTLCCGLIVIGIWDIVWMRYLGLEARRPATTGQSAAPYEQHARPQRVFQFLARLAVCVAATAGICYLMTVPVYCDYGIAGILAILFYYLLRPVRPLAVLVVYGWMILWFPSELYAWPAVILLILYNGQRGRQLKWFFYWFYPCHLMILYLVRLLLYAY